MAVKRAYRYRFYPTPAQIIELSRTFGCVRKVYNLALETRATAWKSEQRRVNYAETSALLTEWKRSDELAFLNEVSCVPLQQCLRHLQGAFVNFWQNRAASAVQVTQAGNGQRRIHAVGVPIPRWEDRSCQDRRSIGGRVVASASRRC